MTKLVDPFIPATNRRQTAARRARPVQRTHPTHAKQPLSAPLAQPAKPALVQRHEPALPLRQNQPYRPYAQPPVQTSWLAQHPVLQRLLRMLQVPAVIVGSLLIGILAQSAAVGQIVLLIYAAIALVFRIESRTTFLMAFLLLCGLVGLLVFRSNNAMAVNFAVYLFILLLTGVVSLWRELRERYV